MAQLAIQLNAVATEIAVARMRSGNISPTITHKMTPHDTAKKKTNACAAINAVVPWAFGIEMCEPDPVLYENAQAANPNDTVMPADPIRASGFRPIRSMNTIATTVPMMLTIDVDKLIKRELDWSIPTDCHKMDE